MVLILKIKTCFSFCPFRMFISDSFGPQDHLMEMPIRFGRKINRNHFVTGISIESTVKLLLVSSLY